MHAMAHSTNVSVLTRLRPSGEFAQHAFNVDERNHVRACGSRRNRHRFTVCHARKQTVMAKVGVKGRPGQKTLNFTTHGLLPVSATQEDVFKAGGEDMVQVSVHCLLRPTGAACTIFLPCSCFWRVTTELSLHTARQAQERHTQW